MTQDDPEEARPAQRRLAARLRALRDAAGLTGEQLGQRCGWTQSKVSKIETGRTIPQLEDVKAWARAVGASGEGREELLDVAEAALTVVSAARQELRGGRGRKQERIGKLEAATSTIRVFQSLIVPGLLQTAEYARRVFSLGHPSSPQDIADAVQARLNRQAILFDQAKHLEFVVTEAGLRWRPGPPEVLVAQLDRIVSVSTLANVKLGIIPLAVEATSLQHHGFVIFGDLEAGDEDVVVSIETITDVLHVRDADKVAIYLDRFTRLQESAVFGQDARRLLASITADLQRT
jgi:transcriptional regulator with XRE-family HTH domain